MSLDQVWYEESDKSVTNNSLTPHSNPLVLLLIFLLHPYPLDGAGSSVLCSKNRAFNDLSV